MRACVRVCVCVCVRACMCACRYTRSPSSHAHTHACTHAPTNTCSVTCLSAGTGLPGTLASAATLNRGACDGVHSGGQPNVHQQQRGCCVRRWLHTLRTALSTEGAQWARTSPLLSYAKVISGIMRARNGCAHGQGHRTTRCSVLSVMTVTHHGYVPHQGHRVSVC